MSFLRSFTVQVTDRAGRVLRADVEIEVDWNWIAKQVGGSAILNKGRKSTALAGAVIARVTSDITEQQPADLGARGELSE